MRTTFFIAIVILSTSVAGFVNAQTVKQVAPIPGDPLELATGPATIADSPERRSAILNLLERARQNNNLHINGMNPFYLKASFNSGGPAGSSDPGDLEESWLSGAVWRWRNILALIHRSAFFKMGLQSSDSAFSEAALKLVKNTNYGPAPRRELVQRDVFINVQFVPAQ